jgi:hypothetical protein
MDRIFCSPWKKRIAKSALVLLYCLVLPAWFDSGLRAQSPTEEELKAAFIYHFAQFVEWPPDAFPDDRAPIVIGVLGDDSFREVLTQTVENKVVQGRKFVVRKWKRNEVAQDCQILFIASSESTVLAETLQNIKAPGVLTIGEADGFAQRGGMINFILSDKKLNFEINRKSAKSAGLKISSNLLTLAKAVWE